MGSLTNMYFSVGGDSWLMDVLKDSVLLLSDAGYL